MIDWNRVGELFSEIGEDDFEEVIDLFLEEADEVAMKLCGDMPFGEVESALHFLKGSALNLGFLDLARMCQDGEKAASTEQAQRVDLAAVAECYQRSKVSFLADLQSKTAA